MELDDAEPRKPLLPPSSAAARGYAHGGHSGIVPPEAIIADTHAFVKELARADKIAFGGACLVILSGFLPWKETAADGEVLGLMGAGAGALLAAVLVIGAIFVRKRNTLPKLEPSVPWMTQLGVSFCCILYTLICIKSSIDATQVQPQFGNEMIWNSSPSAGVFIGLIGAIIALVGSVMGLRERT